MGTNVWPFETQKTFKVINTVIIEIYVEFNDTGAVKYHGWIIFQHFMADLVFF